MKYSLKPRSRLLRVKIENYTEIVELNDMVVEMLKSKAIDG